MNALSIKLVIVKKKKGAVCKLASVNINTLESKERCCETFPQIDHNSEGGSIDLCLVIGLGASNINVTLFIPAGG